MSSPLETPQKYQINEHVKVNGWSGSSSGTIQDIQWVYHSRLGEHTWGYFIEWDEGKNNPFTMTYVPQGYLQKEV
jgi:hypothetical protein